MARKLRIAASVFFAVVAVALCVLWVRSYSSRDTVMANLSKRNFQANSVLGRLSLATLDQPIGSPRWYIQSRPITKQDLRLQAQFPAFSISTPEQRSPTAAYGVGMPYWAWLLFTATAVAAPWIPRMRWRFSLRTMLIVTTLVAVVLGLGVWLAS